MLHALPALLDELEQRLMKGEDPMPLLASVSWPELVGWPQSREEALELRFRLQAVRGLITGLQAPIRATLAACRNEPAYSIKGLKVDGPLSFGTLPDLI